MKFYVGTSGWAYGWNPDGFEWFMKNSGLNAVELNSSFYRFPFPNQIKAWKRRTIEKKEEFRWSVKVNRFVTHVFKFSDRAFSTWKKFERLFKPLDEYIDFYLFQLPPNITPKSAEKIEKFFLNTGLEGRFALEWRNLKWFSEEWVQWAKHLGLTLVSVDAPDFTGFPRKVFNVNGIVYLRMHGRTDWYSHYYTEKEMEEIVRKIVEEKPKKVYIFFNNDTNMLRNARSMFELLSERMKVK